MNVYGMLENLVDNSTMPEPNKTAAREIIKGLEKINALGSVTKNIESEVKEVPHTHTIETRWDITHAGKVRDYCTTCGTTLSGPYEPRLNGNSMYFRR